MKPQSTSREIVEALGLKHSEDVFVRECKNGPTQTMSHARLDAWAMIKSWAHPKVSGYEVKISRSDFLRDDKWRAYLPMCNELYFVAPKGLIKDSELATEVGLIELVGNSRLVTRKKAQYRDITISEDTFRYILMCRAKIGAEVGDHDPASRWKDWLKNKEEDKSLGYEVSKGIREHVEKVESKNRELEARMKGYDDIREVLKKLGVTDNRREWMGAWDVERRIRAMQALVPPDYKLSLKSLSRSIECIQRDIEQMEKEHILCQQSQTKD